MADYLPLFYPGQVITRTASGTIAGGQLVRVSGDGTVAVTGGASTDWLGVAAFSVVSGDLVTVWTDGVQRCIASGAIVAGAWVTAGAAGTVVTAVAATAAAAGTGVGIALTGAADGALAEIKFLR
jgi:Na+/proline symporter